MARDGNGIYNRPVAPYVYDTVISETDVNSEMDQMATALTDSIAKDGQTVPTANLPMGGYKHTSVAVAAAQDQYGRVDQIQKSALTYLTSIGGAANAITATAALGMTALTAGMRFHFIPASANTNATVTLDINAIGAITLKRGGSTALTVGDIVASRPAEVIYDGTYGQLVNPYYADLTKLPLAGGTMTGPLTMSGAAINEAEGGAIASATTIDLDAATGNFVHVTGTTTITTITLAQGAERTVVFDDALTLTDGASLLLGGENISTAANDVAVFRGEGSGVTRLVDYSPPQIATASRRGGVEKATQAETNAGTADKYPSAAELKATRFVSTGTAISTTSAISFAHGHGIPPIDAGFFLQCTSADIGYASGDRIHSDSLDNSSGGTIGTIFTDATNIGIRINSVIRAYDKGGTTLSSLNTAKWDIYLWSKAN